MMRNLTAQTNGRIALFMGAKYWPKTKWYDFTKKYSDAYELTFGSGWPLSNIAFGPHQLLYNSSWSWLLPVLEKIRSLGYTVKIEIGPYTQVQILNSIGPIICTEGSVPLTVAYQAVVKFIQRTDQIEDRFTHPKNSQP